MRAVGQFAFRLAQRDEHRFLAAALGAHHFFQHIAGEFKFCGWAEMFAGFGQQFSRGDVGDAVIQRNDLIERIVAVTFGLGLIFNRVGVRRETGEHPAAPGDRLHAVQQLHRFLTLHAGDDRADRRRCRCLAALHLAATQQVARTAVGEQLPIRLRHRAFVTGAIRMRQR